MKREMRHSIKLCCLAAVLCIALAACGKSGTPEAEGTSGTGAGAGTSSGSQTTGGAQVVELVYAPEWIEIDDQGVDYQNMQLFGDTACYVTGYSENGDTEKSICRYSLKDRELNKVPIEWQDGGSIHETCCFTFDEEGNTWLIVNVYPADFSSSKRFLYRFDAEGKVVFCVDVTKELSEQAGWVTGMAVDARKRIYVFDRQAAIWLYDDAGEYYGEIPFSTYQNVLHLGAVNLKDGRFLVCMKKGSDAKNCTLAEIDFEKKQLIDVIAEYPLVRGICPGTEEYDFLVYDEVNVFGYDLTARKQTELFDWGKCDINGYYGYQPGVYGENGYFCTVTDWGSGDNSIVLLTKRDPGEVPVRAELVLATVNAGGEREEWIAGERMGKVVKMNRNSSRYHVTVKKYDTLTSLYTALLAKEPIDLIDLSGVSCGVDVDKLSRQGALADLSPYLEKSGRLSKDSFVDGVLNAYSCGGRLVGIPDTFSLRTFAGDLDLLKNKNGLALSEFYDISKNTGGKVLVDSNDGVTKDEMLRYLLLFNEDSLIDWEKKECHFDSPEFAKLLEVAGLFPERAEYMTEDGTPKWQFIENGGTVFAMADLSYLRSSQTYEKAYGEHMAFVGFPTPDGSGGSLLLAGDAFGITASSGHPDEAWEFIEDYLCRQTLDDADPNELYYAYATMVYSRFPARKDILDYMVDYRIEQDKLQETQTGVGLSNWEPGFHSITREEVDAMMALVPDAKPYRSADADDVLKIVSEEAGAYYSGQRSIEDVAAVIQNRVQLYVNEQN